MLYFCRLWICLLSVWCVATTSKADPYDKGLEAYKDGDYSKALKVFQKALKSSKDKFDKASMLVMMGASAVKLGKNGRAKEYFGKALKLDSGVQLASVALKDRKVKKVFSSAQTTLGDDDDFGSDGDDKDLSRDDRASKRDRDKDKDKEKDKKEPKVALYVHLLPGGLNEFLQGRVLQGVVFGGGQALALLGFFILNSAADSADKDASSAFTSAQERNALNDPNLIKFLDENEAYVKDKRQNANLSLLGFGLAYGLSVVDSAYHLLGSSPSPKKASKRRSEVIPEQPLPIARDQEPLRDFQTFPTPWRYDMSVLPTTEPKLYLGVFKEF